MRPPRDHAHIPKRGKREAKLIGEIFRRPGQDHEVHVLKREVADGVENERFVGDEALQVKTV